MVLPIPNQEDRKRDNALVYALLRDMMYAWPDVVRMEGFRVKNGIRQGRALGALCRAEKTALSCSGFIPAGGGWWTYAPSIKDKEL